MMPMEKYLRQLQREAERDKRGRSTGWHAGLQVWVDDDSSVARVLRAMGGEPYLEQANPEQAVHDSGVDGMRTHMQLPDGGCTCQEQGR